MQKQNRSLREVCPGEECGGFTLVKKEYVTAQSADLYTLRHRKTGAELLYFDRADENKTFAICFKTLPQDNTGVFHILEHSVLNGSRKFPVKEPFVSMLQSSMQTFLNAMTYGDKTVYPVSSRNEQDFFHLMAVYLDAVFCPLIYERPEIFAQEGWHYEFDEEGNPYCNGVVFSEMKGAYAEVDTLIGDEIGRLLFPDTCYGYVSGGHPDDIPSLSYEQFVETHRRFYHPSNAKIFLDGTMDIDTVLRYIDEEYLDTYAYRPCEADFTEQTPHSAEKTVCYEACEGEETQAHMAIAKILGRHDEVEKIYATAVLADYLTGSNHAPLKRALLEAGLAQDVTLSVMDEVYQPVVSLVVRNTQETCFSQIKTVVAQTAAALAAEGLDREALGASLERLAFTNREITEPYGVELALRALSGWLYGDDPLTHIDNVGVFDALRQKRDTGYFEALLQELLANPDDKSYLYVLPSLTKAEDDAKREAARLAAVTASWDAAEKERAMAAFASLQRWQQSADSEEALATLPHLDLADIPKEGTPTETVFATVEGRDTLKVVTDTNGIVYLHLFFDIGDFSVEELQLASLLTACFGELGTAQCSAFALQTRIKATLGALSAQLHVAARPGDRQDGRPYLQISASLTEDKVVPALALLQELLQDGTYDDTEQLSKIVAQNEYYLKQALIGDGMTFAVTRSLAAFSKEGRLKELLEGETYIRWFSALAETFPQQAAAYGERLRALAAKAFAKNRLFVGYSGRCENENLAALIRVLPETPLGEAADYGCTQPGDHAIDIPAGVGFSALGHNVYALGETVSGSCAVLSTLMTYGYLWNTVRVQGGAYGTGMNIRINGDIYCYSYRDPNLAATRAAFDGMADFLEEALEQGVPLEDSIISTVNATEPLRSPSGRCKTACYRHLNGITAAEAARFRREILETTPADLEQRVALLRAYAANGSFCAVGDKRAIRVAETSEK